MLPRKYAIKSCFTFSPHRTGVSTLSAETENTEIAFLLKCCMLFCQQIRQTPGHC